VTGLSIPQSPVVAVAADEAYAMPLAVTVRSMLEQLRAPSLTVYVLDGGLSVESKRRLARSWESDRLTVQWVSVDHATLPSVPLWGRMRLSTYFRLLIPYLIPDSETRVIWLDTDTVVLRDVAELWAQDQGDSTMLAVQDMVVPFVASRYGVSAYEELGLDAGAPHFNAGVMVIDLDRWRAERVSERAMEYLARYRQRVCFWDQEGLNAVLVGRWKPLDARWNVIASVAGRSFYRPRHLNSPTYRLTVHDPWIVHYAGTWKPWILGPGESRSRYFHYLDMTAWAGWRPSRTVRTRLMAAYEATFRDSLYPLERWWIAAQRRMTLKIT
jgi:lipopolysaccharide biosynthesis glycosyltransferase